VNREQACRLWREYANPDFVGDIDPNTTISKTSDGYVTVGTHYEDLLGGGQSSCYLKRSAVGLEF